MYYSDRYQAINFSNISFSSLDSFEEDNTIEFRVPNGTIEEVNNDDFKLDEEMYDKVDNKKKKKKSKGKKK